MFEANIDPASELRKQVGQGRSAGWQGLSVLRSDPVSSCENVETGSQGSLFFPMSYLWSTSPCNQMITVAVFCIGNMLPKSDPSDPVLEFSLLNGGAMLSLCPFQE